MTIKILILLALLVLLTACVNEERYVTQINNDRCNIVDIRTKEAVQHEHYLRDFDCNATMCCTQLTNCGTCYEAICYRSG